MTKEIATELLEKLVADKRLYKQSLAYKTIKEAIDFPGVPASCGTTFGRGRNSNSKSWQNEVRTALTMAGIPFTLGNDSPQGGRAGDFVIIHLNHTA